MMGLVWFVGTLAGAFVWLTGSPAASVLSLGELLAGSIAVGTIAPAYISYLVSCCVSMLEVQSLIISNLLFVLLVAERFPRFVEEMRRRLHTGFKSERLDALIATGVVIVGALVFWPLYTTRMIPEEGGKIYSGGSCWADLPIHMTIAESFLTGRNQDVAWGDMHSPVFAGEKMVYPFIPDWHAAVLVKIGATMREAFLWPGFLLCLSFLALLFFFAVRLTRSRLGALLAILLTVGSGGQGGINLLFRDGWASAVQQDVIQNDVTGEGKVFWFAFVPHVFLPQRGANFAYPLALFVLLLVWKATDTTAAGASLAVRRSLLVHAAAFAALTPLVQAHTFIGLGILIATVFVLDAHKWLAQPEALGGWLAAGVVAATLGYPQLALFTNHVAHGSGGSFVKYGWIYLNHDSGTAKGLWAALPFVGGFFQFWWTSLGPAVPLFLLALTAYGFDAFRGIGTVAAGGGASGARGRGGVHTLGASSPAAADGIEASSGTSSGVAGGSGVHKRRGGGGGASLGDSAAGDVDDTDDDAPRSGGAAPALRAFAAAPPAAVGATNDDPASFGATPELSLAEHLVTVTLAQLPAPVADVLSGRTVLRFTALDALLRGGNEGSATGRSLDALKLGVGAGLIFAVGNYVNFQPWDRDNCKLYYLWVFVATALVGSLLATPVEFLLAGTALSGGGPGLQRVYQLLWTPHKDLVALARAGDAHIQPARKATARAAALGGLASVPVLLFFACTSGLMMFIREYSKYDVLLDQDQIAMGKYIKENIPPKAVFIHRDIHIMPSSCLAGRPTLVAYTGWMWSHGYNYGDRARDRDRALEGALKDSDDGANQAMRRWGVRYVLGEYLATHPRPRQQEHEEALVRHAKDPSVAVPPFDPDLYLDGQLKRVFRSGRMDLLEVQGYPFPPG